MGSEPERLGQSYRTIVTGLSIGATTAARKNAATLNLAYY